MQQYLQPDWPAPAQVRAFTSTRQQGFSAGNYAAFNLAAHVGDDPQAVQKNRAKLREELQLPAEPVWLQQVHGSKAIAADEVMRVTNAAESPEADAAYTTKPHIVCAVQTADCLPLLVCDRAGTRVAAIHAGWRGLAAGVIEAAIQKLACMPEQLLVWLGPAIGPQAFQAGDDVRQQFMLTSSAAAQAFSQIAEDKWLADIYLLAKQRLSQLGIKHIYGGDECTYTDAGRFYSFRREQHTGRMASLIWLTA